MDLFCNPWRVEKSKPSEINYSSWITVTTVAFLFLAQWRLIPNFRLDWANHGCQYPGPVISDAAPIKLDALNRTWTLAFQLALIWKGGTSRFESHPVWSSQLLAKRGWGWALSAVLYPIPQLGLFAGIAGVFRIWAYDSTLCGKSPSCLGPWALKMSFLITLPSEIPSLWSKTPRLKVNMSTKMQFGDISKDVFHMGEREHEEWLWYIKG